MEREILKKAAVSSASQRNACMIDAIHGATWTSWSIGTGKEGTLVKIATRAVA
jgi:hypothetical protein